MQGYAETLDLCRDTLYEWADKHPEFSDSMKKAILILERLWTDGSLNSEFNTAFTIFYGKNIFKWTDKPDIAIETPSGMAVNVNFKKPDDDSTSD